MSLLRSRNSESEPRVEINVVPLVDVALVLLIIFMITTTFVKSAGMQIKLPTSSATQVSSENKREIVIGIDAAGAFVWEGSVVTPEQMESALRREASEFGMDIRVIVRGDERTSHGRVVQAMSMAQDAGFGNLVIATQRQVEP